MAAEKKRNSTPATSALDVAGVEYSVHEFDFDPRAGNYGLEAAAALGVEPSSVFKTLVVEDGRQQLAVVIVPVTGSVDLKAAAAALGWKKAAMADPALAQRRTGYVVGGISPIGQRRRCATLLDSSALELAAIFVSAGRRGMDLRLDPRDLAALTAARCVPIAHIAA